MRAILAFTCLLFFSMSCSVKQVNVAVITIKGSDSMLQLTENLAEEYMRVNPGISIYVYGGGTSEGVRALIKDEIDICTASRNLKPEETKTLADYYGSVGMFYLIAKEALCIYVNPVNPVKNFTLDQLKYIFECNLTNWDQLGGKNQKIIPVIRNINSGTHFYFKEHVLSGDNYCDDAVVESTTGIVIEYIEKNDAAIGYGSMGYTGDIYYAKIDGIEPVEKNVRNDTYPITRYLHFYTTKVPNGAVKNFIDWVLSPVGQQVIEQSGYIPLWELPPN